MNATIASFFLLFLFATSICGQEHGTIKGYIRLPTDESWYPEDHDCHDHGVNADDPIIMNPWTVFIEKTLGQKIDIQAVIRHAVQFEHQFEHECNIFDEDYEDLSEYEQYMTACVCVSIIMPPTSDVDLDEARWSVMERIDLGLIPCYNVGNENRDVGLFNCDAFIQCVTQRYFEIKDSDYYNRKLFNELVIQSYIGPVRNLWIDFMKSCSKLYGDQCFKKSKFFLEVAFNVFMEFDTHE
jgi:hypothetical protein